jgi:hypothetical protein
MLGAFILGIALLVGGLLIWRWVIDAEPRTLVKALKWLSAALIFALILFFALSGRLAWAVATLPALIPWFLRIRSAARMMKNIHRMFSSGTPGGSGQTSEIKTRFVSMSLDHETGRMEGRVLEGENAGRELEDMSCEELIALYHECRTKDVQSARVLESYMDKTFEDWRTRAGPGFEEATKEPPSNASMDREEAYRILGLEEGASDEDIKEAYRRLMDKFHPDHGGSDYLAAKINQAKAALVSD